MFVYLHVQPFPKNRPNTFRRLVFHVKQRPYIAGERITDLFIVLNPAYRKGNMIRHGKKDAPVNAPKDPLAFLQYLLGNLQKYRIHILHKLHSSSALCMLTQRIHGTPLRRFHTLTDLFSKANALPNKKVFPVVCHVDRNNCVVIQRLFYSEHPFSPKLLSIPHRYPRHIKHLLLLPFLLQADGSSGSLQALCTAPEMPAKAHGSSDIPDQAS